MNHSILSAPAYYCHLPMPFPCGAPRLFRSHSPPSPFPPSLSLWLDVITMRFSFWYRWFGFFILKTFLASDFRKRKRSYCVSVESRIFRFLKTPIPPSQVGPPRWRRMWRGPPLPPTRQRPAACWWRTGRAAPPSPTSPPPSRAGCWRPASPGIPPDVSTIR